MSSALGEIIAEMDPGLARAVARVLEKRVGKDKAIQKPDLLKAVRSLGHGGGTSPATLERQVRTVIVEMRKNGHLVCSSSGDGGYYLAGNRAEYDDFVEREYRAKIRDMAQTAGAMDKAAQAQFGEGVQMGLF